MSTQLEASLMLLLTACEQQKWLAAIIFAKRAIAYANREHHSEARRVAFRALNVVRRRV